MSQCKIEGCDRKYKTAGLCGTHYWRWRKYGSTEERPSSIVRTARANLLAAPSDTDLCVIWPGKLDASGYGVRKGAGGKVRRAHRLAWEVVHGPIPEGMTVDHLCFVPACINVLHLRLLTALENCRNQRKAFRTECPKGHAMTEENTYRKPGSGGRKRVCRTCSRAYSAAYKARKDLSRTMEEDQ